MRRLTRSLSPAQNNVAIPGKPSLPSALRTVQPNVTAQPWDVYAASPWRGPGTAPVQGSGCGIGCGIDICICIVFGIKRGISFCCGGAIGA